MTHGICCAKALFVFQIILHFPNNMECVGRVSLWCDFSTKYCTKNCSRETGNRYSKQIYVIIIDSELINKVLSMDSAAKKSLLPIS